MKIRNTVALVTGANSGIGFDSHNLQYIEEQLALAGKDQAVERSARNIHRTTLTTVSQLNAWEILRNRTLLVTKEGLQQLLDLASRARTAVCKIKKNEETLFKYSS